MLLGGFSDNWKSRCHLSPKFNHLADAALIKRQIGYLSLKFIYESQFDDVRKGESSLFADDMFV